VGLWDGSDVVRFILLSRLPALPSQKLIDVNLPTYVQFQQEYYVNDFLCCTYYTFT
jgi:hypothetical protein